MKKLFSLMALGQALSVGSTYATSQTGAAATVDGEERQRTRVAACSSAAQGMKGNERRAFIRSCLSIDGKPPRQTKLTICNVEAKGLKGEDRKTYMINCLKQ